MLSYEGKIVLAPMVRVGTLPMRLLALEYGADLVWTPETIDKKIIGSIRTINGRLGTVDYIKNGNTLVLRTHKEERSRLIFQLGSADPELALQAALTVAEDVSGIDLNCGCPKHFSIHAGMGAALLKEPERLCAILQKLVTGIPHLPITAKIRLLPEREATLELIQRIVKTGIKALTIHFRTPAERPKHPAHYEWLADILKSVSIPIIANGDLFRREDFENFKKNMGVTSLMLARAAQWNASIFRSQGLLEPYVVTQAYLLKSIKVENPFSNTKYTVLQMWLDRPYNNNNNDKSFVLQLQQCKSMKELCSLFKITCNDDDDDDAGFDANKTSSITGLGPSTILYNAEDEE